MNFEHHIQINNPENPLVAALTRDHLWQGLLHRVDNPLPFLPGLVSCTLLERETNTLRRQLNFGTVTIEDRVSLVDGEAVSFDIQPSAAHPGGCLTITIEEPQPEALFLRFAYQTSFANNPNSEERAYIEYVKSAYHQSDIDCVHLIRQLAAGESLQ